jgi:CIC family chloride channel protein
MAQVVRQPNLSIDSDAIGLSANFWLLLVLTGIGAGIGGGILMRLLYAVQRFAWSYQNRTFLEGVRASTATHRILVLLGAGVLAGAGRRVLRYTTGGHGGEISESIWFHSGRFPVVRTLSRAVLSIVLVGMGASIGREGAAKQAGAVSASKLADWGSLPSAQRRLLAACGAGAGMAAVYNVPFGGAVFAIEVLLGTTAVPLVIPALAASLIATGVSWTFLSPQPTYLVPTYPLSLELIVWALLAGPLAGLAAALYVRLIAFADSRKPRRSGVIASPILVFAFLGAASVRYPQLLGNGKDLVQEIYLSGLGIAAAAVLLVLKPLATAGCLGSGAPGGLFTPTLTYGALFGVLLGRAWTYFWPGAPLGSFAIIGSGAVLAAATEGPISSIALVLELTRHIDALMVPLLLAIAGASIAARSLDCRSIYSARIRTGKAAAAGVSFTNFQTISAAAPYSEIAHRFLAAGDHSSVFLVVDNEGKVIGQLAARDLIHPQAIGQLATTTAADLARPVAVEAISKKPAEPKA